MDKVYSYNISEKLNISAEFFDVNIKLAQEDKIKIELMSDSEIFKNLKVIEKQDNNALSFSLELKHKLFNLGFKQESYLDVYLPKDKIKNLTIKTTSGDFHMEDSYSLDQITLGGTSGDYSVNNLKVADELNANFSSGDIDFKNVSANSLKITVTSGSVKLSNFNIKNSINLNTTSGDSILNNVKTEYFKIKSSSGDIRLTDSNARYDIKTTSGSIDFKEVIAKDNSNFKSSSGDLSLDLADINSYIFNIDTNSGDIRKKEDYNPSGNLKKINIETTSGDISY